MPHYRCAKHRVPNTDENGSSVGSIRVLQIGNKKNNNKRKKKNARIKQKSDISISKSVSSKGSAPRHLRRFRFPNTCRSHLKIQKILVIRIRMENPNPKRRESKRILRLLPRVIHIHIPNQVNLLILAVRVVPLVKQNPNRNAHRRMKEKKASLKLIFLTLLLKFQILLDHHPPKAKEAIRKRIKEENPLLVPQVRQVHLLPLPDLVVLLLTFPLAMNLILPSLRFSDSSLLQSPLLGRKKKRKKKYKHAFKFRSFASFYCSIIAYLSFPPTAKIQRPLQVEQ